jgi:hypothetical protein
MAGRLLESPAVQGLFELSSKILGYDMVGLCAQGPQERLPQCASPGLPQCASLTTMRFSWLASMRFSDHNALLLACLNALL